MLWAQIALQTAEKPEKTEKKPFPLHLKLQNQQYFHIGNRAEIIQQDKGLMGYQLKQRYNQRPSG